MNDARPRWTVDELARRSGISTRTIRAHQSAGLLPRPSLDGRTGYYDPEHLERLGVIIRLQRRSYSLAAIADLLRAWENRQSLAQVLGLDAEVRIGGEVQNGGEPERTGHDWADDLFTAYVAPRAPVPVLPGRILN